LQHISETSTTIETYVCNIGGREQGRSISAVRVGAGGVRAPPTLATFVGAPWLSWRRHEAPPAPVPSHHRQRRQRILTTLGWGRGQGGTARTEGGGGMVALGGERKQWWRRET
jgi:hypothetical protein